MLQVWSYNNSHHIRSISIYQALTSSFYFFFFLPEWHPVSCLPASCQDVARVSSIAGQCKANAQGKVKRVLHSIIKGKPFYSLFSSTTFLEFVLQDYPEVLILLREDKHQGR